MQKPLEGVDSLSQEFGLGSRCDSVGELFSYVSVFLFALYVLVSAVKLEGAVSAFILAFSFAAAVSTIASALARYYFFARADALRSAQLLADSYNVPNLAGADAGHNFFTALSDFGTKRLLESLHQNCFFKIGLLKRDNRIALSVTAISILFGLMALYVGQAKLIELCWIGNYSD